MGGGPMARQRSLGEYRAIDLGCFVLMLAVFEPVLHFAATKLFPAEPYTVSAVAALTAIVMMRWGPWAAIHAVLGGILACLLAGARWDQYLIYGLGNLLSLVALLLLKAWGKEETRKDALQSIGFGLMTALLMQLGRGLLALVLGNDWRVCLGFFTTGVITDLFTAVVVWVARRLDGIFEDQIHYLMRIQKETQKG